MKRSILPLAILTLVLSGCSGSETPASPSMSSSPLPSPTVSPEPAPEPSLSPSGLCAEISFDLDPSIASGFTCEFVPAYDIEDLFHEPEFVWIVLEGTGNPEILVYPIKSDPESFSEDVSDIEALVSGAPLEPDERGYYGPFRPSGLPWSAAQTLFAQYEVKEFDGHAGIRYLTEFRQDVGAPTSVLYTYQGVTTDGRYWIAVNVQISHAVLEDGNGAFPDAITWDQWCMENSQTCYADITEALNAQAEDSFVPSIEDLDALVASITITP